MDKGLVGVLVIFQLNIYCICVVLRVVSSSGCGVTDDAIQASKTELMSITSEGYNDGTGVYSSVLILSIEFVGPITSTLTLSSSSIDSRRCNVTQYSGDDNKTLLMFIKYSTVCPGDQIFIYDGLNETSSALADGVCGSPTNTESFSTTQRFAYVKMITDATNEDSGFVMDFVSSMDYSGSGCSTPQTLFAETDYKLISSPGFPNEYPSDSFCQWILYNPGGQVDVDVIVSDIEDDIPVRCDYDKLQLNNGDDICENNKIAMFCSVYPDSKNTSYTSKRSEALVTFESDPLYGQRGFLLRYKASEPVVSTTSTTSTSVCSSQSGGQEVMDARIIVGLVCGSVICVSLAIVVVAVLIIQASPAMKRNSTPTRLFTTTMREASTTLRSRRISLHSLRNTKPENETP